MANQLKKTLTTQLKNYNLPGAPAFQPLITFENGIPRPVDAAVVPLPDYNRVLQNALSLPYAGDQITNADGDAITIFDERYRGATLMEVMMHRLTLKAATGDKDAVNTVLDRLLGKPKQAVESVNVSMSYQDFLSDIAQKESTGNIIDITPQQEAPYDFFTPKFEQQPTQWQEVDIDDL